MARPGTGGWLLITTIAIVACGGPPAAPIAPSTASTPTPVDSATPSSTTGGNEACDLVPQADLEAVLGEVPAAQALSSGAFPVIPDATYAECLWKTEGGQQIVVRVVRGGASSDLGSDIDSIWQAFPEYEDVVGLGDEGRIHTEGDLATYVVTVRRDAGVFVTYQTRSGDAVAKRDAVITLASDVLASMPS